MERLRWIAASLALALTVGAAACDQQEGDHATSEPPTASTPEVAAASPTESTAEGLGDAIVVASGPFTEVVFALGHGDRVKAVDTSSIYPPEAAELPKIGFFRKLSPEPLLAVEPSALIVGESAGPETAIERVKATDVRVEVLEEPESFDEAKASMRALAALLGSPEAAEPLIDQLEADLAKVDEQRAGLAGKRALFIYARGPNVLMVAGGDTSASTMMKRVGLVNAAEEIEGFKPMTPEAVIAAKPDLLVLTEKGAKSVGGWKGVAGLPGVQETPAADGEKLATVDDLAFLSFGPRSGRSLLDLQRQLKELFDGA